MNSVILHHPKGELHPYTTAKHYDPAVKAEVYEAFMKTDKDLVELALEHGVAKEVISAWSKEGQWLDRKKEVDRELMRIADEKYKVFILENRLPVLRRQIRISGKLENAIEQVIDEELKTPSGKDDSLNDMKLKRMAEALAAVTQVSTKAIGLADTIVQNNGNPGGRVPLVAIGIGPQVPGERTNEGPSITVREIEQ